MQMTNLLVEKYLTAFVTMYTRKLGDFSIVNDTALVIHGVLEYCDHIELQVPGHVWEDMCFRYSGRMAVQDDVEVIVFEVGSDANLYQVRVRNERLQSRQSGSRRIQTLNSLLDHKRALGDADAVEAILSTLNASAVA